MKIRFAQIKDKEDLKEMVPQLHKKPLSPEDLGWIEMLVAEGRCLVAEIDGRAVGYLAIEYFGTNHQNFPNSVFLAELYVKPEARMRGAGRQLVEEFLSLPHPTEFTYYSVTHDPGEPSLDEFYEEFGFRNDGHTAADNVRMLRDR